MHKRNDDKTPKKTTYPAYSKVRLPSVNTTVSAVLVFIGAALLGVRLLTASYAATFAVAAQPESGTLSGNASAISDSTASGGSAVKFGSSSCVISSILVNSCRPWLGAAVRGYPQPASNGIKDQALYHEQRIGRQLDIIHTYHGVGNNVLSADDQYFATRANTYLYANWKPASPWNTYASNNTAIDSMANSIKSVAPHKIFLTIWHEPENDVTTDPNCPNVTYKGSAGTPTDYRNMWNYVHSRFAADGVTNVVWVMNYMNYKPWQCLVPDMWPGNSTIDWVTFENYSAPYKPDYTTNLSDFYNLLTTDSDSTHNFLSKPWGIGEWGDCSSTDQTAVYQEDDDAKADLDSNMFPKIKMYMYYDDNGNNAGMGCLTEYSLAGTLDATEQQHYNAFANDPIFLKN